MRESNGVSRKVASLASLNFFTREVQVKIPLDMVQGTIHKTKCHGDIEVISYVNARTVKLIFKNTGYETQTQSVHVRSGNVRDPTNPSVFGVGFIGEGVYTSSKNSEKISIYTCWHSMMQRCYSDLYHKKKPTYSDCTVDPCWHNFQSFAEWYEINYPCDGKKYQLDKDLLIFKNREYSENNCIFVPQWLNIFSSDNERSRGELLIGVNKHKGGLFVSSCSIDGLGSKYLGLFKTEIEAHQAWKKYKLELALKRKHEMDEIDIRIYPNVVKIIESAR